LNTKNTPKKVGRPSLFKHEYCQQLIDHMAQGYSYTTFAAKTGTHLDTLYDWEKLYPEFLEAKKTAFHQCQLWWEKQGIAGLWQDSGGEGPNRNLNPSLWIFNMKCRFPKDYRDVVRHEFVPGNLDAMTKKELIEETKRTIEFLEAEIVEESKDAQKALPPAKK